MELEQQREQLVYYGLQLLESGLTKGTGGNLSVFHRESGIMAITPSGMDYRVIQPEDIVLMKLDGTLLAKKRTPSSEWRMHAQLYQTRTDLEAIIHAHSVYATVLACLGWELPPTHYMIALAGPSVRCAPYATYGTQELAKNAAQAMEDRKAVLLANHGILTGAADLANAFHILEEIEYCCEVYYRAKSIGEPVILPQEEMKRMAEKFQTYGQASSVACKK